MVTVAGLSLPATVQHFVVWRDPDHFFGAGKPFGRQLLTYDRQTLAAMEFLQRDAHPGDVVLTADNLIAPVLRLTNCPVPVGYFSSGLVARFSSPSVWSPLSLPRFENINYSRWSPPP